MLNKIPEDEDIEKVAPPQHLSNSSTSDDNSSAPIARTQKFSLAPGYQLITDRSKPIASFSVLNSEELVELNSFVGSSTKPNAIVRPIQRTDPSNSPNGRQYGRHQHQPRHEHHQENDTDSTHTSISQPYRYQLSSTSVTQPPSSHPHLALNYAHTFPEELDRKLRYLHGRQNHRAEPNWSPTGYRHSTLNVGNRAKGKGTTTTNSLALTQRPLFITTVPTGIFLPPPKEMPLPQFLRPYVYSSHPMVLSDMSHSSNYTKSPTFPKDKPRHTTTTTAPMRTGDKQFTTTSTAATASSLSSASHLNGSQQDYAKSIAGGVHLTNEQFRQQIQQHRGKRNVPKEPYKNIMFDRRVVRGSNFAKTRIPQYSGTSKHSADDIQHRARHFSPLNGRYKRSASSRNSSYAGQRDEIIQTDDEIFTDSKRKRADFESVNTQTELVIFSMDSIKTLKNNGVDAYTEIDENELCFQEDNDFQTLIDYFVDMCMEHSVLEFLFEDQMNDWRIKYYANNDQDDTSSAAQLLHGHIAKLVPEVLENLESAAYIEPTKKNDVMKTICPWLTVEVAEEVGHIVDSREILTVIIEEIIKQRAAAFGDINSMPEIVANIEEIIEVPSEIEQATNDDDKENIEK